MSLVNNHIPIIQGGISYQGLVGALWYHPWMLRTESLDWFFSQTSSWKHLPVCRAVLHPRMAVIPNSGVQEMTHWDSGK